MTSDFNVAVHALVYLSHRGGTLSSEELAQNICTNAARVRKVLSKLKKAGLVETKEGADGGYLFDRDAGEVTLRQIGEALDCCFVSANWRSGDTDLPCLVASGMGRIMDDIYGELDECCKARLEKITIRSIGQKIFGKQP